MKKTKQVQTSKPSTKWLAIKTGAGEITGYIEGFWATGIGRYVTIPGASRYLDPADFAALAQPKATPSSAIEE